MSNQPITWSSPIISASGVLKQVIQWYDQPQIGYVTNIFLQNGIKQIVVDLEVANFNDNDTLVIGLNLFEFLDYELKCVPFTYPREISEDPPKKFKSPTTLPASVDLNGIAEKWKQVLVDNQAISSNSHCKLLGAEVIIEINCFNNC